MDLCMSPRIFRHAPTDSSRKTALSAPSLVVEDGEMYPDPPDSSGQPVPPPTPDKRAPQARPASAAQSNGGKEAEAEMEEEEEAAAEWVVEEEEEGVAEGEEEEEEGVAEGEEEEEERVAEGEEELEGEEEEELKREEAPPSVRAWSAGVSRRSTFQLQLSDDENNNERPCSCAKILSRLVALEGEVAMAKKEVAMAKKEAAAAMAAAMAAKAEAAKAEAASAAAGQHSTPVILGTPGKQPRRKSLQTTPKSAAKGEQLRKLLKKGTLYGR